MEGTERQARILALLETRAVLRVGELASALYVSEATVRRDLHVLFARGLLRRVRGGVALERVDLPLDSRSGENAAAKEEIARRAASLVREGQTVLLDSSSTVQHLLPYLTRFRALTVITNSHRAVDRLADSGLRVISTGGTLFPRNMVYVGPAAEAALDGLCADLVFLSSRGVGEDGEITDSSEEETALRRVMLRRAARSVFLCDAGKVGLRFPFRLGVLDDMDDVITDGNFPAHLLGRGARRVQTEKE